jgi:hypothetical protein
MPRVELTRATTRPSPFGLTSVVHARCTWTAAQAELVAAADRSRYGIQTALLLPAAFDFTEHR